MAMPAPSTPPAPDPTVRWTAEMVRAMPEERFWAYQVVDGELSVSPSPRNRHQRIVLRLLSRLLPYEAQHEETIRIMASPADISWDTHSLVQPDIFVYPASEDGEKWSAIRTLLLVIEVLSPGTARFDRVPKRRLYQANGVRTLWLVDHDAEQVEIWRPEDDAPRVERDRLVWAAPGSAEPVEFDLRWLFRR